MDFVDLSEGLILPPETADFLKMNHLDDSKLISVLAIIAAIWLFAACSSSGLTGDSAGVPVAKGKQKQEGSSWAEGDDSEYPEADQPTQISGSFLVCGQDNKGRDPQFPVSGVQQGCAVIDDTTNQRKTCQLVDRVKVTYSDATVQAVQTQPAQPGSFWHVRFVIQPSSELTGVSAQATCGNTVENLTAKYIDFTPQSGSLGLPSTRPALLPTSDSDSTSGATYTIFVTSGTFFADMISSVTANQYCNTAAGSANLPGTFRALLSFVERVSINTLTIDRPVVNTDQETVATVSRQLWSGRLQNAIKDESGNVVTGNVWTGSNAQGIAETISRPYTQWWGNCFEWTRRVSNEGAGVGQADALDGRWLDTGNGINCSEQARIYCIGGENGVPAGMRGF